MIKSKILISPIEQFNILPLFDLFIGFSNLTIFYFIIISLFSIIVIFYNKLIFNFNKYSDIFFQNINNYTFIFFKTFYNFLKFIPTNPQYIFELYIFEFIKFYKSLVISTDLMAFFYSIFTSICFILFSNVIGLFPYSFTITAQIFITFNLGSLLFISFNIMGIIKHSIMLFNLVIPTGVFIILHILLIPIEIVSYIFRPISLGIRLFANIMAGHTLLKVICGFLINFIYSNLFLFIILIPFSGIIVLFGLESFVALIQTYVFLILICLFLKDILQLSH